MSDVDENETENDSDNNFINDDDDEIIPYQEYIPPNPYLGQRIQLPRGLDAVVNRVSSLIFKFSIFRRGKHPSLPHPSKKRG